MTNRIWKAAGGALVLIVILGLLAGGYYLGFAQGKRQSDTIVVEGARNTAAPADASGANFSVFWETWKTISDNYLRNANVKDEDRVYGAVKGLVSSLKDPYSEFFTPAENQQFQEDVQGNFSGIGAEIGIRKDQLTVIAPLKGSPAERAGLKAADKIIFINGSSTEGLVIDEAVRLIRGPEGSEVKLTVFRDGWDKTRDFAITRGAIEVPTLDFSMKNGVAYVQLYGFNANAPDLFAGAAAKALQNNAKGMVLDMRNDPGGYLDVAVNIAGWFVPKGTVVVSERQRVGAGDDLRAEGNNALGRMPIVVILNQGSASASEILAGALRDLRGAKLVGEQSYGKGTVQEIFPLKDGSSVKITIAHWVLPKGQVLEGAGLKPDYEVKLTDDDVQNGRDPQLDKALQLLK